MKMIPVLKSDLRSSTRSNTAASTVTSRAVVGSSMSSRLGLLEHGHGDHRTLLLAPGELVGVAGHHVFRVGHVDPLQHGHGALPGLLPGDLGVVAGQHLGELLADGKRGVHGLHGVLVDHGDPIPPKPVQLGLAAAHQLLALELDRALLDVAVGDPGSPRCRRRWWTCRSPTRPRYPRSGRDRPSGRRPAPRPPRPSWSCRRWPGPGLPGPESLRFWSDRSWVHYLVGVSERLSARPFPDGPGVEGRFFGPPLTPALSPEGDEGDIADGPGRDPLLRSGVCPDLT